MSASQCLRNSSSLCGPRRASAQVDVGEEEGAHMPAEAEARWQVIPGFRHGRREADLDCRHVTSRVPVQKMGQPSNCAPGGEANAATELASIGRRMKARPRPNPPAATALTQTPQDRPEPSSLDDGVAITRARKTTCSATTLPSSDDSACEPVRSGTG